MAVNNHNILGPLHHQSCRVLYVEDDADDRFLGRKTLEQSRDVKEVLCFSSGAELIAYINAQSNHATLSSTPTVIVIDLNMPHMDGFEILQQLKSESFLHSIPIIVVSSAPSCANIKRAMDLKAAAFFRKPMNTCDLHSFLSHGRPWPSSAL